MTFLDRRFSERRMAVLALVAASTGFTLAGCKNKDVAARCIAHCDPDAGAGQGAAGSKGEGGASNGPNWYQQNTLDLDAGSTPCTATGEEICDGLDNDCNGQIDDGIDFTSPRHCGSCAMDRTILLANVMMPRCVPPDDLDGTTDGVCEYEECAQDYYDLAPSEPGCEYYCAQNPNGENSLDVGGESGCGRDDDCDGQVDEDVDTCNDTENCGRCGLRCVVQHGTAACTSRADADADEECNTSNTACSIAECDADYHDANGSADDGCDDGWIECDPSDSAQCDTFCVATGPEICNGVDDDCDCQIDEELGADPRSACGVISIANPGCNPTVVCSAGGWSCQFEDPNICGGSGGNCAGATDTTCDNRDNDCDGIIDEVLGSEGADDGEYIRPELIALSAAGPWVFAYEASRPDATTDSQGSGNGYVHAAPPGEPLDATMPCSSHGRIPWTNVSAFEVEQACDAIGGRICRASDWTTLCQGATGSCDYGFTGCETRSDYESGPYCNLDAFDVDPAAGDQDSLIPTASELLSECAASWTNSPGNIGESLAFDATGNARELVRCQEDRSVCVDAISCARDCCTRTWTNVSGPSGATLLCGDLNGGISRRLSGQPCTVGNDEECCDSDANCSEDGDCSTGVCENGRTGDSCVVAGFPCVDSNGNGRCEFGSPPVDTEPCCDDAPVEDGRCGDAWALPHATYPLLGGSYRTAAEGGARCDYDFFKVSRDFRLFDTGFRCCFDTDPR